MQVGQQYQNRDYAEILTDILREKVKIVDGIPVDIYDRQEFEEFLPFFTRRLVIKEVFNKNKVWILNRIIGDIGTNPRDLIIRYIGNLSFGYFDDSTKSTYQAERLELIYALYGLPQYMDKAVAATINLCKSEFPKTSGRVEKLINTAKSKDEHKAESILHQLGELYTSKEMDDDSTTLFAVAYSMYMTLKENFLIPSLCMYNPDLMIYGFEKKLTSVDKVIKRLSTGNSNPYATQKLPDSTLKSFAYAQGKLSQTWVNDHWIVKKYVKKRREALFSALGISEDKAESNMFSQNLFNEDRGLVSLLCELFHIPTKDIEGAFKYWDVQESVAIRSYFVNEYIDTYFEIKLKRILDKKSDEELERITTREIIGSIGMEDIENDVAYFKQLFTILSLFLLANRYRKDYYSLYNFSSPTTDNNNALNKSYQKMLSDYRAEIDEKDKIIEKYQLQEKKREIRKSKATEKPLLSEISSLKKTVSKKDQEIEDLKTQLEEAREYYSLLDQGNKPGREVDVKECDLSVLENKRIVFVCNDIESTFPTIKKLFPNSVLLGSDTTQVRAKNVDLVVFFTKYISHSIYFKAKKLYKDAPEYAYNRANIKALKNELAMYFLAH